MLAGAVLCFCFTLKCGGVRECVGGVVVVVVGRGERGRGAWRGGRGKGREREGEGRGKGKGSGRGLLYNCCAPLAIWRESWVCTSVSSEKHDVEVVASNFWVTVLPTARLFGMAWFFTHCSVVRPSVSLDWIVCTPGCGGFRVVTIPDAIRPPENTTGSGQLLG